MQQNYAFILVLLSCLLICALAFVACITYELRRAPEDS